MANKYVRQGAAGTGSGNDWTNAYTDLPANLTRGDTYYIADGSYAGYVIDDATNGVLVITIKKATVADHGTETGWSDAYGDGVATWGANGLGGFMIDDGVSYITVDGYSIHAPNNRGFYIPVAQTIAPAGTNKGIYFENFSATQIQHINFKNINIQGPDDGTGESPYYEVGENTWGVYGVSFNGGYRYITFDNVRISGMETLFQCANMDDLTFENGELSWSRQANSDPLSPHANVMFIQASDNVIVRHNIIHHWDITGIYTSNTDGELTGHEYYGNIFYSSNTISAGAVYPATGTLVNPLVYNNTFVNIAFALLVAGGASVTGGEWKNNIHYNVDYDDSYLPFYFTKTYNWFSGSTTYGSNAIAGGATDPFVDIDTDDYHLVSAIAGTSLGATYDEDIDGVTRGSDGVWDIGAFEFSAGDTSNSIAITGKSNIANFSLNSAYPISDITVGNWTSAPLYEKIDEVTPNDGDVITSPQKPTNETCEIELGNLTAPTNKTSHTVKYRFRKVLSSHSLNFTVALYDGNTLIAQKTHTDITTDWVDGTLNLSSAEATSITNYSDLRVRLTASQ
jgi:hypothetical protein